MKELVESLVAARVLKTKRLINAFLANDRVKFVPEEWASDSYLDVAIPIGLEQTISQPYTVAFMLELLDVQAGQKVLDVGFGSGWTTGILAHAVGDAGKVYSLEISPELYEFGKSNLAKFGYKNVELFNQSGLPRPSAVGRGWEVHAPFDRILVSATAPAVPGNLKAQLKVHGPFGKAQGRLERSRNGGKMVIPIGVPHDCAITLVERVSGDEFKEKTFPGFAFVPLTE